jgi:hypothetical protein
MANLSSPQSGDETASPSRARNTGGHACAQSSRNIDTEVDAGGRRPAPLRSGIVVLALMALWVAVVPPLQSQESAQDNPEARSVRRLVQDASRALQAGNAASFLRWFDRKQFAGYPALESHIVALTTQSNIASSIQIVEIEQVQGDYHLRVDWLLELTVQEAAGPLETRREVLEVSVAAAKKGEWRITSLGPLEFFRPQGQR